MHTLIPITLLLADRTYRVKVRPEDEETVRRMAKTINEKILEFKTQFAGKDMQDYIAMTLIWFATDQQANNPESSEIETITNKLTQLEKMLDDQLKNAV